MVIRMMLSAAAAIGLFAAPAMSQQGVSTELEQGISLEDAKRIAEENGISEVNEIEREDDGGWEVEGRDASGNEMEIEISSSGEITETEQED